jgi:hypothetical protein
MRIPASLLLVALAIPAGPAAAQTDIERPRDYALTNARIVTAPGRVISTLVKSTSQSSRNRSSDLTAACFIIRVVQVSNHKVLGFVTSQSNIRWRIHERRLWCWINRDVLRMRDRSSTIICKCPGDRLRSSAFVEASCQCAWN